MLYYLVNIIFYLELGLKCFQETFAKKIN